jgi:deoxyhypusine synthase
MTVDLDKLKRYPLAERSNLVSRKSFGKLLEPTRAHWELIEAMPDFLGARSFRTLVEGVHRAWKSDKLVGMSIGAHVLKVGLGPLLVDLMERGVLKALAMHGAGAIHDFELALTGATSEDVKTSLEDGSFGMAEDTGRAFAAACKDARQSGQGLGRAFGLRMQSFPFAKESVLAAGARLGVPVTVHVAIGADIVHMHPELDGADLGAATLDDFRKLASTLAQLEDGVWMNVGSAVVLPEVFLKALTISRNLNGGPKTFLAANLDMIRHYRPKVNVLDRPTGGKGLDITGHHEMLLPLLRLGVLSRSL